MTETDMIATVRRFNRTVTQRVGALHDRYLASDRPLGQARVLWEIGHGGGDVTSLRTRLDLDSGYLSRLLRALEADGLIIVAPSTHDGRERTAALTGVGRREWQRLDERSDALARGVLDALSPAQRADMVGSMARVEHLLIASMVEIAPADPSDPVARFCLRSYYRELDERFSGGFDVAAALPVTDDDLTPPRGVLLVARLHGEGVGCGAVKFSPDEPPYIKRMWVAPSVRGLGLGRRLLGELEAAAAATGATSVRLETNSSLAEAIAMYRSAGYAEVEPFNDEPYAHHWFVKELPRH
jgi:DNA-binding MarR family transcriptional regulator/GNAT superfamily N-acetyltransferase